MPTDIATPALIWCSQQQAPVIASIMHAAKLSAVGVGTPEPADPESIARTLRAPPAANLRSALSKSETALVLLADPGWFGVSADDRSHLPGIPSSAASSGTPDALILRESIAGGKVVLSFEPMPGSVLELQEPTLTRVAEEDAGIVLGSASPASAYSMSAMGEWAAFCPSLKSSVPMRNAADVVAQLGKVRVVAIESLCGPGQQSLGARLYDACLTCVWLMGIPDRVDAAYSTGPAASGRSVHALPGQSLRGLSGDMTVNLRYGDGRAASIVASDQAGRWQRSLNIFGDHGRLRVYDDGFVWFGNDGNVVDSSREESRIRGVAATQASSDGFVRAVADQIQRAMDRHLPADPPMDIPGVLATAGAALLSARTGEGESPATLLRMARAG